MKAILVFSLPEEQPEFDSARTGAELRSQVEEFRMWLRNIVKHGRSTKALDSTYAMFCQMVPHNDP